MMVITRMLRRYLLSFNWKDAPASVGRRAGQSSFFIVIAITLIKLPGTETILNLLKKKYLTISGKSNYEKYLGSYRFSSGFFRILHIGVHVFPFAFFLCMNYSNS